MTDQKFPEPTVGIFIFNPDGELLLTRTHKWHGKYGVPGGHIELGETARAAAQREAREETGLQIHDLEFLCWHECVYDPQFWKPRHFIFLDFTARIEPGPVTLNEEAESYLWMEPRRALAELDLDPFTAASIHTYLGRTGSA